MTAHSDPWLQQAFLGASVLTMLFTPALIGLAPRLSGRLADLPLPTRFFPRRAGLRGTARLIE